MDAAPGPAHNLVTVQPHPTRPARPAAQDVTRAKIVKIYDEHAKGAGNGASGRVGDDSPSRYLRAMSPRLALLALLGLSSCALTVQRGSDGGDAPDDVAVAPEDISSAPAATLSLPLSVRALSVLHDGGLAVGGSWSGEVAFAGESPGHDPAAPAWRGAVAWIGPDRRVFAARALRGREVSSIPAAHGVAALTESPDGALWAVLPAARSGAVDRVAVVRFARPGEAAAAVTELDALGDSGLVEASVAPHGDGVVTCVRTTDVFAAPSTSRTVRVGRAWCGWVRLDRAPETARFLEGTAGALPTELFAHTLRAGLGPRGAVWTLNSFVIDDPDRLDSLRPEDRARLETRPVLAETSPSTTPRRLALNLRLLDPAVVSLGDGPLRFVSLTADARPRIDDHLEDRTQVRSTVIPPLFDALGRDVARGVLVAHAQGRAHTGLVLALPSMAALSVLDISPRREARLVAVTPDLRGESGGPVVLAETTNGWVLAQSGRLDGPSRPTRAEVRWLPR